VNAFVDLRQDIHARYASNADRDRALAEAIAGPPVAGSVRLARLLEARILAYVGDREAVSAALSRDSADPLIRPHLIDALGRLSASDAAAALRRAGIDGEREVRIAADAGILPYSPQELRRRLIEAEHDDPREAALSLMAETPDPSFVDQINRILPEASELVGTAAKRALARCRNDTRAAAPPGGIETGGAPLVLQTVFYGDPRHPGRSGSGGIGTLVLRLGDALAESGEGAATMATTMGDPRRREELGPRHVLYRIPVGLDAAAPRVFLDHRGRIRRSAERVLDQERLRPRTIHVRFLDDASLAVARVARRRGLPCAVTLTPDPHRSLVSPDGSLRRLEKEDDLITLHRVWIGDELARDCRGLMAIGRRTLRREIMAYFPAARSLEGRVAASVDEGVPVSDEAPSPEVPRLILGDGGPTGLAPERLEAPAILSVGRLAPVKNLPALARAWADGLWRTHNLIIIGGDLEAPSAEERRESDGIRKALDGAPAEAAGRAVHLPAQDAATIRRIETWFGRRPTGPYPDLYVASSLKEEFGLAILEAMSAGLVACAPIRGGAGAYIRPGVNGYLIDTRDAASLRREIGAVLAGLAGAAERVDAIRGAARETVRRGYSIEAMSREYAEFYRRMLDER